MRMNAYYFGFTPTGAESIDRILSAVACAGKAYHHTEGWTESIEPYDENFRGGTCAEWIQNAAKDAAEAVASLTREKAIAIGQATEAVQALKDRDAYWLNELAALQATLAAGREATEPFRFVYEAKKAGIDALGDAPAWAAFGRDDLDIRFSDIARLVRALPPADVGEKVKGDGEDNGR